MAKHRLWSDEYWLLLMQLYLRKPVGVKPIYSRGMVELALELHIPPQFLYEQMFRLRQLNEPKLEQLWTRYARNPKRLKRGVQLLRQMKGFGMADDFYDGVEVQESFERDFKTIEGSQPTLMPVHLIMILDLYFRLTASTMVVETPEIQELARLLKLSPKDVVEVMDVYKFCDPILHRDEFTIHPLMEACQETWDRFAGDRPERLAALAAQLTEYFKS